MAGGSYLVSLSATLALGAAVLGGCSGEDDEGAGGESTATGGADGSGGDAGSGGDGSGGDTPASSGGSPPEDTYMSDAFSMTETDGEYVLEHGDVTMRIDPMVGGRIIGFSVSGTETLVQEGEAAEYGSTFWPSPQIWSWPPATSIAEIDPEPYSVSEGEQRLVLTSENNNFMGAIVTKTFAPAESDAGAFGFSVTYTIENTNASPLTYAAWEISRVGSGVTFYPEGPGGLLEKSTLTPESALGHGWYEYEAADLQGVPKIFADGKNGWLAWALGEAGAGGAVVIKSFPDIEPSSFAMGEAEIEIYADVSGDYMEVEQQGPAVLLQPGETLYWRVEWYGTGVPDGVVVETGSQGLIDAVVTTLGG